jgi:hypothetical protein
MHRRGGHRSIGKSVRSPREYDAIANLEAMAVISALPGKHLRCEYCRPEQATTDQYGMETSEWLNLS